MTNWYDQDAHAAQIITSLVELKIFKYVPGNRYHFSDEFWQYFRTILWNKMKRDLNTDPRREDVDIELYKPETVRSIILSYIPAEQQKSISEVQLKHFVTFVRGLFMMSRGRT